ncbi:MAG: hypothetical protein NT177_08155 [Chloroflexi bacterium]|nr:hypothetical protein [Chloroflexota bacterium]
MEDTDKTYGELDTLQIASALSAFIYLPVEGKIRMHSTMYMHEGNYAWASRVLLNVAGVQLLTACGAQGFEAIFQGSQADTTPHPVNGYRETADEMVTGLGGFYGSAGKAAVTMPKGGFEEAGRMLRGFNVLAFSDKAGLGAEFHFVGDYPAVARQMAGKRGVETSLYMASVEAPHRVFGNGLVSLLTLPAEKPQEEGHRWCNRMNLLESREWTGFHMLGTWLSTPNEDGSLIFFHRCFLPAFPLQPELVLNLALCDGLRSRWISSRLI